METMKHKASLDKKATTITTVAMIIELQQLNTTIGNNSYMIMLY